MADDAPQYQLTYGITPPKLSTSEERRLETAQAQTERINGLGVDALVVYDLQDESSRTDIKRPFPFLKAIDPLDYAYDYLRGVEVDRIVYRSVSGHDEASLSHWLNRLESHGGAAVLVGAPSQDQKVSLRLGDAYRLRTKVAPGVPLGGVMIAERHEHHHEEDTRVLRKIDHGCRFFISQAVYSVTASKNVISDLHYRAQETGDSIPPILVTLSPCGSKKTLEFMRWLGVSVPRWLQNELLHAGDILEKSIDLSLGGFTELHDFAREKGIPLGCNVESVSLRKEEIEASVEMVRRVKTILGRG